MGLCQQTKNGVVKAVRQQGGNNNKQMWGRETKIASAYRRVHTTTTVLDWCFDTQHGIFSAMKKKSINNNIVRKKIQTEPEPA